MATPDDFKHFREAPGFMNKVNWFVTEYRVAVTVGIITLGWLGFQYAGPGARITAAEGRIGSLEKGVARLIQTSEAVARLQCFNVSYTREQRELAGLDCEAVLRGEYVRSPR